jgi:hypothetical protein
VHGLNRDRTLDRYPTKWLCQGYDQDGEPRVYGTGGTQEDAKKAARAAALRYIEETVTATHRALAPISSWGFTIYPPIHRWTMLVNRLTAAWRSGKPVASASMPNFGQTVRRDSGQPRSRLMRRTGLTYGGRGKRVEQPAAFAADAVWISSHRICSHPSIRSAARGTPFLGFCPKQGSGVAGTRRAFRSRTRSAEASGFHARRLGSTFDFGQFHFRLAGEFGQVLVLLGLV